MDMGGCLSGVSTWTVGSGSCADGMGQDLAENCISGSGATDGAGFGACATGAGVIGDSDSYCYNGSTAMTSGTTCSEGIDASD